MRRQFAAVFAVFPALLLWVSVDARQQPVFRARALAVRVDVLVTDGRVPVGGLTAQDFELRDNDVAQAIEMKGALLHGGGQSQYLRIQLKRDLAANSSKPPRRCAWAISSRPTSEGRKARGRSLTLAARYFPRELSATLTA